MNQMQIINDPAAREILTAMQSMTREEIWATFDLTEVVSGVDLERYAEDVAYAEEVLEFARKQT